VEHLWWLHQHADTIDKKIAVVGLDLMYVAIAVFVVGGVMVFSAAALSR
jgi:hypothetical protein